MGTLTRRVQRLEADQRKSEGSGVAVIIRQLGETAAAAWTRHAGANPGDARKGLRVFIQRFS